MFTGFNFGTSIGSIMDEVYALLSNPVVVSIIAGVLGLSLAYKSIRFFNRVVDRNSRITDEMLDDFKRDREAVEYGNQPRTNHLGYPTNAWYREHSPELYYFSHRMKKWNRPLKASERRKLRRGEGL